MELEHLNKTQIVLLTTLVAFVSSIATSIVTVTLMDQAPPGTTTTIRNVVERTVERVVQAGGSLAWAPDDLEGPFDSSYSLAIVNRELARALKNQGNDLTLRSREGHGDYVANVQFLDSNPDIRLLQKDARARAMTPDVVMRKFANRNCCIFQAHQMKYVINNPYFFC